MSDHDEEEKDQNKEQDQESAAPPRLPSAETPPDEEETTTISLLDLINESSGPSKSRPHDEETADIPSPIVVTLPKDDESTGTVTGVPTPAKQVTPKPSPIPLSGREAQSPRERPLILDPEATEVQPRVAFSRPRSGQPIEEAPTQIFDPLPGSTRPAGSTSQSPTRTTAAPQGAGRVAIPPVPPAQRGTAAAGAPRDWGGCLLRIFLFSLIAGIVLVMLGAAGAMIGYTAVARTLPLPNELSSQASDFETVRIYDRLGNLLYSQADPNIGNRLYVPLEKISPHLIRATIATEDKRFYQNPGFDIMGIARAIMEAARNQEPIAGTSTITQQLVRAVLLDEDERTERTFRRKVREIILAAEISRTYEKNEILELYLNEIYFGNLAYGIEAAAQTYFRKPAAELTLAEATLLAGLPQAPALWDPFTAPDKALGRQSEVLSLMMAAGFISVDEARVAQDEANRLLANLTPPTVTIQHPHFTLTVLQQAEELLGAQSIYRGGLRIYTTLDPETQQLAETSIAENRERINAGGANNASMVVLNPQSGEIMALVGSVDFHDEDISGQVNMALTPRQPGSSIKPFVYLSAFEKGWTTSTLLWDVPTQFPPVKMPFMNQRTMMTNFMARYACAWH